MKKLLLFLAIIVSFWQPAWADNNEYITSYNALLKQYVNSGEKQGIKTTLVNYKGWSDDAKHAEAMQLIAQVKPEYISGKEKMAFWINAYNLLTIDLIIKQTEHESIKNTGSLLSSPWKSHHWTISGKDYTLDAIENNILRKMGDPRIHAAINCASLSCPDLRVEAYSAEKLDAQLDEQMRKFLQNDTKGLRIKGSELTISKIFDWFADDFKEKGGVVAFIRKYSLQMPENAVVAGYFDYNWKLNGNW
jgi:hypothetical protein